MRFFHDIAEEAIDQSAARITISAVQEGQVLWPMAIGLASWADLGVETIAKTRLKVPFRKDISAMSAIAKQKSSENVLYSGGF